MAKRLEIQNDLKKLKRLIDDSKYPTLETSIARKQFDPITDFDYLLYFDKLFFEYLKKEDVMNTYNLLVSSKRFDNLLSFFKQNYLVIGNTKTNTQVLELLANNNKNLVDFSSIIYANINYLQGAIFDIDTEKKYVSTCIISSENLINNKLIDYIFENSDRVVDYNSLLISKYSYILEKKNIDEIKKVLELLLIGMEKTQDLKSEKVISKCYDKINELKIEEVEKTIKLKLRQ